MTIRVAINGYGRIGRNILRAHYEDGRKHDLQIVAINDLGNAETNAHLTRHDTAHGKFPGKIEVDGDHIVVNGDRVYSLGGDIITAVNGQPIMGASDLARLLREARPGDLLRLDVQRGTTHEELVIRLERMRMF